MGMVRIIRFWILFRQLHAYPHIRSPWFRAEPTMLKYTGSSSHAKVDSLFYLFDLLAWQSYCRQIFTLLLSRYHHWNCSPKFRIICWYAWGKRKNGLEYPYIEERLYSCVFLLKGNYIAYKPQLSYPKFYRHHKNNSNIPSSKWCGCLKSNTRVIISVRCKIMLYWFLLCGSRGNVRIDLVYLFSHFMCLQALCYIISS